MGRVEQVAVSGTNREFTIGAVLAEEPLRVDQSIAHDGACLTVARILSQEPGGAVRYQVTAVEETLQKTTLGAWEPGTAVNLERCLRAGGRLDGHFVQGHVDGTGEVLSVEDRDGSWRITFGFDPQFAPLLVPKGSICVSGVSLTVVDPGRDRFSVAVIPYTWTHTHFHLLRPGSRVNLEFDILGKYLLRWESLRG